MLYVPTAGMVRSFANMTPALDPSSSRSWLLPVSVVILWLSVAFILLSVKCLLTDVKCTRWGPEHGANFGKPLSTAVLNLFLVGATLALITALKDVLVSRRRPRLLDTATLLNKLKICAPVGCSFGMKSVVSHWALRVTPTAIFELFHGISIVFIAIAAWIVVGEKPTSIGEVLALCGVLAGSAIAASGSFFAGGDDEIGLFAFLLNIASSVLAGAVVATLRWTTLRIDETGLSIVELTCLKTLIGAAITFPFAIGVEGAAMFTLSSMQQSWLLTSSAIMLVYHLNLSLLCYLAPALVVGVVEALKPLPVFTIVALMQTLPETSSMFWIGTFITLASAVSFKLLRTLSKVPLNRSTSSQYLLGGGGDSNNDIHANTYQHHELGRRFPESTPLNDRIGNDLESDSDAGSRYSLQCQDIQESSNYI
mmetsp:Transcript_21756/g.47452  ORF Transcript_21756/g.47452 Transcript_21756/m.47452 type:complete len:424 (+) Transcript_21756:390-1661(+)